MSAAKKKPARKKPARDFIMVQVDEEQRATFTAAADADGLPVSTWLRRVGLLAARQGAK